jgi:hypothetical protein
MAQSQYATDAQIQQLAITPAAYARFEAAAPGCVTATLQAESSMADTFLSSQLVLPLQTAPQGWDMALTLVVCYRAAFTLYFTFGFNPASPDWQVMTQRKEWADKWLDGVSNSIITLNYADSSGMAVDADRAGDFVISDAPVGFTDRGESGGAVTVNSVWSWW